MIIRQAAEIQTWSVYLLICFPLLPWCKSWAKNQACRKI